MPFQTDTTWTPTTYRRALAAWSINNSRTDSKVLPRKAEKTKTPRHAGLSRQLRNLLTWRAMHRGEDWTTIAANDNEAPIVDTTHEIRPTEKEIMAALKGVDMVERRHAKLGGGGGRNIVPVSGEISRAKVERQGRKPKPDCVVRLGNIHFSNGGKEERALIRDALGRLVMGSVRIPLGGLMKVGKYRAAEAYVADNANHPAVTVGYGCFPIAVRWISLTPSQRRTKLKPSGRRSAPQTLASSIWRSRQQISRISAIS